MSTPACPDCGQKVPEWAMKQHAMRHWTPKKATTLPEWVDGVTSSMKKYDVANAPTMEQLQSWIKAKPPQESLNFALDWSVMTNHFEHVKELIAGGAQINEADPNTGLKPMRASCSAGEEMARYVLCQGGNPLDEGLVYVAGLHGHFELVKMLILAGADFTSPYCDETPIAAITARGEDNKMDIVKFLKEEAPKIAESVKAKQAAKAAAAEEKKGDYPPTEAGAEAKAAAAASGPPKRIMISYQWDSQATVKKLAEVLKKAGYNVWLDLEQMSGSTLTAMAEAVEGSTVVLVGLSAKYQASKNCRLEGEYAHLQSKIIIPMMMEANFRPTGWLGLIMGGKLWFDFSAQDKHDGSYKNLLSELERTVGPGSASSATSSSAAPPPPPPAPASDRFKDAPGFLAGKGVKTKCELDSVSLGELAKSRSSEGPSVAFLQFLLTHIVQDPVSALKLSAALSGD